VSPAWSATEIPVLCGTTAVVTGATGGIGLEIASGLATNGADVVLAVRSVERGNAAASAIPATTPARRREMFAGASPTTINERSSILGHL
jgi:NAD(P)-dependent dehydrogenase (short-subunit alcohol dehydrogenase family)